MHLNDFDYQLPPQLIAQSPLEKRDDARLMIVDRHRQTIAHDYFKNIGAYLPSKAHLVLNDSRVIPARLLGFKESTKGKVEIFLLAKRDDESEYDVLLKPMKRLKDGDVIRFDNSLLTATVMSKEKRIVRFNQADPADEIEKIGHMPLPPYIQREDVLSDRTQYQTVYARVKGSVAAPTAGLHFTNDLLKRVQADGHSVHYLTLHVNYGTFKSVETDDITQHVMHSERYQFSQSAFEAIANAKARGEKIVSVGTTSTRVLESTATTKELSGTTNIFIYPGYEFQMVDILVTNFHLPKSTLLMLVSAFGGMDLIKRAYQQAIEHEYRFYSYGDGMVVL